LGCVKYILYKQQGRCFFVGTRGNQRDVIWMEPKGCHMDGTKGMSHGQNQRDVTWMEPKGCHMDLILYR